MGNPTSYLGSSLTWEGKQLKTVGSTSYAYDESGLRTQKTVSGTTTNYYYNGSVLISLVQGSNTLLFSYDAQGRVAAVNFNGTYYYYIRNGQGDVIKLIDNSGTAQVTYSYDTWGKQISCGGTLASTLGKLNPFRYRGYVYDEETGWYYLQSRYYNPTVGRFLSADVMLSTGQGVLGHNTYAYCLNNPGNYSDPSGMCSFFLGIKYKDCGLPTCSTSRNYGASADFIPCSDENTLCYGYVLGYVYMRIGKEMPQSQKHYKILPRYMFGQPEKYDLDAVTEKMVKSIKDIAEKASVTISDDLSIANATDLVIAARVTKTILIGVDDYHFAVRLQDGTWADKRGTKTAFIGRITSDGKGWGRYNSKTNFIIIHFGEEQ